MLIFYDKANQIKWRAQQIKVKLLYFSLIYDIFPTNQISQLINDKAI